MGKVDLRQARQRQIDKQNESMVIPAGVIDPVLYATIERNYSELLRILIDDLSPILVPQFIYFIGKSKSQGERIIKKMIELKLLGVRGWKGQDYLYPLRNAVAWRENKHTREVRGTRTDYSDMYLFDRFMRNEMVIYRNEYEMFSFFMDIEKRLRKLKEKNKFPPGLNFRMEGPKEARSFFKKIDDMNDEDFELFLKNALATLKYKNEVTLYNFSADNKILIFAAFSHNEDLKPIHYFRRFKSLLRFAERFGIEPIEINVEVLVEKAADIIVAKKYSDKGLLILNRELNKQNASKNVEGHGRDLKFNVDQYNVNLYRYFNTEVEE